MASEPQETPAGQVDDTKLTTIPVPIAPGPCEPTWKSLGDHFRVPGWFRKAKIGMWLHWGPQAVGEDGDWYAKWMYMPRFAWSAYTRVYANHLAEHGHPSRHGYKDILPLWKAARWDPDKLMALYRRAGARYVIAQGMHHDNFDLWDSAHQPWNSVRIGPKRDIVAGWKAAADKHDMRFGIAFHGDYSLWWFQPAFLSDLDGPLKGVPYDGAQDHTGHKTWWGELGLDLKDLYGIDLKADVAPPQGPDDDLTTHRMRDPLTHAIPNGDLKVHYDFACWYATKWTRRVIDAIDKFSPDFIYFDGGGSFPFCGHGTGRGLKADATPRVIAHLYNTNLNRNNGTLDALAFTKGNEDPRAVAVNYESHVPGDIVRHNPWQTEVGLGEWFYLKGTFYDSGMVIRQMLEAISRDGNYVINIPLTPDGELDPGGHQTLLDMGTWMDIHGEAIHDSSAWDVWGEGHVTMPPGNLGPAQANTQYTPEDIRYVVGADGALYAFLMAWPASGKALLRSLARGAGRIATVTLLGHPETLLWSQTATALEVQLPPSPPCHFAHGLRITGHDLKAVPIPQELMTETSGMITLPARFARCHGNVQIGGSGDQANAGYWYADGKLTWRVRLDQPGTFEVQALIATPAQHVFLAVQLGPSLVTLTVNTTTSWNDYALNSGGPLHIPTPGEFELQARPGDQRTWTPSNLRQIVLRRLT